MYRVYLRVAFNAAQQLRAAGLGYDSEQGQEIFLYNSVQTGFGSRPASSPVCIGRAKVTGA
jgi:hypothetical protein